MFTIFYPALCKEGYEIHTIDFVTVRNTILHTNMGFKDVCIQSMYCIFAFCTDNLPEEQPTVAGAHSNWHVNKHKLYLFNL